MITCYQDKLGWSNPNANAARKAVTGPVNLYKNPFVINLPKISSYMTTLHPYLTLAFLNWAPRFNFISSLKSSNPGHPRVVCAAFKKYSTVQESERCSLNCFHCRKGVDRVPEQFKTGAAFYIMLWYSIFSLVIKLIARYQRKK